MFVSSPANETSHTRGPMRCCQAQWSAARSPFWLSARCRAVSRSVARGLFGQPHQFACEVFDRISRQRDFRFGGTEVADNSFRLTTGQAMPASCVEVRCFLDAQPDSIDCHTGPVKSVPLSAWDHACSAGGPSWDRTRDLMLIKHAL